MFWKTKLHIPDEICKTGLFWKARAEFRHIGLSNDLLSISSLIKITEIIFFQYCYSFYIGFCCQLFACWVFFSCICRCLRTFSKPTFSKDSGTLSECQMVWVQIRTHVCRSLSWSQRFAKVISRQQKSPLARKELKD